MRNVFCRDKRKKLIIIPMSEGTAWLFHIKIAPTIQAFHATNANQKISSKTLQIRNLLPPQQSKESLQTDIMPHLILVSSA